jgi:hypothetical protein
MAPTGELTPEERDALMRKAIGRLHWSGRMEPRAPYPHDDDPYGENEEDE